MLQQGASPENTSDNEFTLEHSGVATLAVKHAEFERIPFTLEHSGVATPDKDVREM